MRTRYIVAAVVLAVALLLCGALWMPGGDPAPRPEYGEEVGA